MPFRWQSVIDFAVLAIAFYIVLRWAKQARAVRIALLIIGLHAGALLARNYDLIITSWVLGAAGILAIAVLLVIFQPELRHTLMRVDALLRAGGWQVRKALTPAYRATAEAAFNLAERKIGALIVLLRRDAVLELTQGGVMLGAEVSRELLESIFQKVSPLHDGAAIVNGSTVLRANVVLPLTQRQDVPPYYGTRHRAAMGLAERTDAVVIAVSEQRGTVTLMQDRTFEAVGAKEELSALLDKLLSGPRLGGADRLRRLVTSNIRYKLAAVGLAALVWMIALHTSGATIRTLTVPIEFGNVPVGQYIASQSVSELEVQLRGNTWLMDTAPLDRLVAHFDLSGGRTGQVTLEAGPQVLNLPPGVFFERAVPRVISVRLASRNGTGR